MCTRILWNSSKVAVLFQLRWRLPYVRSCRTPRSSSAVSAAFDERLGRLVAGRLASPAT